MRCAHEEILDRCLNGRVCRVYVELGLGCHLFGKRQHRVRWSNRSRFFDFTDDGTTLSGTVNKGPNGFNDVLVLYIDSVTGGFADTSGFADGADGLRRAISGFDGGTNRSVMTFSDLLPDDAIALGPTADNFGGLWQLANGGNNSLNFLSSVNLNPTGTNNSPTYTFSLDVAQLGLAHNGGGSFRSFGTYVSNSGFRSDEALPGNDAGTQGWNPFLETASVSYTIVPEPSSVLLAGCGLALAMTWSIRKRFALSIRSG